MKLTKETKILIIGLGVMGGSYAKALSEKGYKVKCITKEIADIRYGMEHGMICYGSTEVEPELIGEAELIVFALYPKAFIDWIKKHQHLISPGTIITDVTGVKSEVVYKVQDILREDVEYIPAHPMAGRERSGVEYADPTVFNGANYIVTPTEKNSLEAIKLCKNASSEHQKRIHDKLVAEGRISEIPEQLKAVTAKYAVRTKIPPEFCYFEADECNDYLHDVAICRSFASRNRKKMADDIMKFLGVYKAESFETLHNYIDDEGVIRKGAISAHKGQRVIIPMNMRDGCLIAVGKGNEDWNCSAPHGAGRLVSRGEAKELFGLDEYAKEMEGIYTTSANESTIDESPMAYKPMDEIVKLIEPTVHIEKIIKPIYNFKASK